MLSPDILARNRRFRACGKESKRQPKGKQAAAERKASGGRKESKRQPKGKQAAAGGEEEDDGRKTHYA